MVITAIMCMCVVHTVKGLPCTGKSDGFYGYQPPNNNNFFRCIHEKQYNFTCPPGLLFNPGENICDWPENVNTSPSEPPAPGTTKVYRTTTTMYRATTTAPPKTTRKPLSTTTNQTKSGRGCQRIVCYYTNWSQYRPGKGKFVPQDIDAHLCTHIVIAFAKLNGNRLAPFEWNDESTAWSVGNYEKVSAYASSQIPLPLRPYIRGAISIRQDSYKRI